MAADISVKIALDGERDYRNALKNCNDALKNADSALKAFDESAKGNEKSVENLQKRQELLATALNEAKKKQETLTDVVDKAKAARDKAAEALAKAKQEEGENSKAVADAEKKYIAANNAVDRWETQLNKANQEVAKYTNEIDGATDETEDFQKVVGNTAAMEALTKIADKVSGVMSKVNKAMQDAAREVESGLKQINKRTGASGEQLEKYQKIATDAFGTMPVSIESASDAVGELATRFKYLGDKELSKLTTAFLQFADVNSTDVAGAIDSTQKALSAFGLQADEAETLLDVFNRTGQNTGANAAGLASKLVENAEAFQQMGLDIYEATAFLGQLEVAGTDSNTVLSGMKRALKSATEEGKPFNEALLEMQDAILNGADGMDGLTIAYDLFGKSGAGIYTAVKNGNIDFQNLAESTDILNDATGNLASTYEATLTTYDQYEIAQNNLKIAADELQGEVNKALAPAMEGVSGIIKDLTDKFKDLPPEVQTTIGILSTVGGKFAEVAPQVFSLVSQIKALKVAKQMAANVDKLSNSTGDLAGTSGKGATNLGKFAGIAAGVSAAVALVTAAVADFNKKFDESIKLEKSLKENSDSLTDSYYLQRYSAEELNEALAKANTNEEKRAILEQQLTVASQANAEATENLRQSTKVLGDETMLTRDVEESFLSKVFDVTNALGMNGEALAGLTYEQGVSIARTAELEQAQEAARKTLEESGEDIDYINSLLADLQTQEADTATETDELGDSFTDAKDEIKKASKGISDSTKAMMDKTKAAIDGMKTALGNATSSITNWFDEVEKKEKLSADVLAKNLQDQIDSMKNWQSNLSYLADKGINQDLLQYLADMGPQGAAYVQAFVDAANGETEVGLEEMNRLWLEKLDLEGGYNKEAQELISAVGVANAKIQTETAKAADGAYQAALQIPLSERDAIAAYTNRPVEAVKDMNNNMNRALQSTDPYGNGYNTGANMVNGIVKGIRNNESAAINAAAAMANRTISKTKAIMAIASPSKVFEEIGMYLDQGLAKGINKYAYAPDMAMTDTMKDLVQLPDLSRYDAGSSVNNEVRVYIGDKELTAIMAAGVVKNISTNQRARYAAVGG